MGQPQQGPPGFFGYDLLGGLTNGTNNEKYLLCLILGALQGASGSGASGGGGLPVVLAPLVGTYVPFSIANGQTGTIPTTAKRWSFENVGTGNDSTFNGTIMGGGIARSDNASPSAPITLVAGAANIITGFYSTT